MAECRPTPSACQILVHVVRDTRVVPDLASPWTSNGDGLRRSPHPTPAYPKSSRRRPKPSTATVARGQRAGGTTLGTSR